MNKKFSNKSTVVATPAKRVARQWSNFQENIFRDIATGEGHTQVIARAGSGKTSTIIESFYHLPPGKTALMVAFNKSIKTDLASRAPEGVEVLTLHSLGFRACRRAYPNLKNPDTDKLPGHIRAIIGEDNNYELRASIAKATSLCKSYLIDSFEDIDQLIDSHGIDLLEENRRDFIAIVQRVLDSCKRDTARVDFDDMIWFPLVHNLRMPQYDFVFIDEAQDLSVSQIKLALKCCKTAGRIISVGDDRQAIYGFRGADSQAIPNIIKQLSAKTLPLSVTYRCAKSIADLAKNIVPDLEPAPNAEIGLVQTISEKQIESLVKPGDFILSRINAPLISWCLTLLRNNIPANIQGRDLGKNLLSLVKSSKAKTIDGLLKWLDNYREKEIERLVTLKRDTNAIEDKVECLIALCNGASSVNDVKSNIERLFHDGDDTNRVILSSTHKAKGMERDRVFMLSKTYRPGKGVEEDNLVYVAQTRAKKELYLVQ